MTMMLLDASAGCGWIRRPSGLLPASAADLEHEDHVVSLRDGLPHQDPGCQAQQVRGPPHPAAAFVQEKHWYDAQTRLAGCGLPAVGGWPAVGPAWVGGWVWQAAAGGVPGDQHVHLRPQHAAVRPRPTHSHPPESQPQPASWAVVLSRQQQEEEERGLTLPLLLLLLGVSRCNNSQLQDMDIHPNPKGLVALSPHEESR